ncbi:MAG: glycosyl hydrolase family 28 protein, partial [Tepidisphaeraceae bacterium]
FDINGCRDVRISNCLLICGDDAIILKATPQARSTERVTISNCICSSNCIAIGIGQEAQSDIRQITVSNCVCYKSHRMFTIGIWDGGTVEDVTVTGLTGDTLCDFCLARPIQMEVKQLDSLPRTRPLGTIRNVNITNVVARTRGRVLITAEKGATLENISLRDVRLQYTGLEDAEALSPRDARSGSSQYANRNLEARKQNAAVVLENVRGFDASDLSIHWPMLPSPPGTGSKPESKPAPPYRVLWARHVQDSRLAAPMAAASSDKLDAIFAEDCPRCVFRVGP